MGELCFFPGVVAQEAHSQRDGKLEGVRIVLGDLDALMEIQRGIAAGHWPNARAYIATEMELRIAALRELLGVE